MFSVLAAGIMATSALVMGLINNNAQQKMMNQQLDSVQGTNQQNYQIWQEQREDNANAVQIRRADLEKAGLNPALAAGDGAQVGNPAQMSAPDISSFANAIGRNFENMSGGLSDSVSKYFQMRESKSKMDEMAAQTQYLQSMASVNEAKVKELENTLGEARATFNQRQSLMDEQIRNLQSSTDFNSSKTKETLSEARWKRMREAYFKLFHTDIPDGLSVGQVTDKLVKGSVSAGVGSGKRGAKSILKSVFWSLGLDIGGEYEDKIQGVVNPEKYDALDQILDELDDDVESQKSRNPVDVLEKSMQKRGLVDRPSKSHKTLDPRGLFKGRMF